MKMKVDGSVRVMNDGQLAALVHEITKRVIDTLAQKKRPRNEDIKDLVALAQTIPDERKYWRALQAKRVEEAERWEQAYHRQQDYVMELKYRLNVWPQEQDARIKEMKREMRQLEEDCANEVAEAKAETERLLAALGAWAYEQGISPGGEDEPH